MVSLFFMKSLPTKANLRAVFLLRALLVPPLHDRSFAQQPSAKKQEIYNFLAAHRYEHAAQAATAYLASDPEDCIVVIFLGLAYRGEARPQPASQAFRTSMSQ